VHTFRNAVASELNHGDEIHKTSDKMLDDETSFT
jgi:hypothetical protein